MGMSRLFVLFISFQLIVSPVSVAIGAETKAQTQAKTIAEQTTIGSDPYANSEVGQKYTSQSQAKSGGYDFYAKQGLAISTSIVGSNIISQCIVGLKVPSIATFLAGSVAHIMSELAGAKAFNENHNKRLEDLKVVEQTLKSQGGEVQKELLEQKLKEEQATLEYLRSRKTWLTAVAVMYATATGLAVMEEVSGLAAAKGAGTAACFPIAMAQSTAVCVPRKNPPQCQFSKFNAMCTGYMPTGQLTTYPNFANPASFAISKGVCGGIYGGPCVAYTSAYHAIAWGNCQPLNLGGGLVAKLGVMAITGAYSAMITRTSGTPLVNYVTMLSGLLTFMVPSLEKTITASYNYPIPRQVTFGISAALVALIISGLNERIKIAEENITKLSSVVNRFKTDTTDDTVLGADVAKTEQATAAAKDQDYVSVGSKTSTTTSTAATSNDNGTKKSCFSEASGKVELSSEGCSSPMTVSNVQLATGTSNAYQQSVNLTNDINQALANGDTAKANALSGQLAGMAAAVRTQNEKDIKARDEMIKANGGTPTDYNKLVDEQMKSLAGELSKGGKDLASISSQDLKSMSDQAKSSLSSANSSSEIQTASAAATTEKVQEAEKIVKAEAIKSAAPVLSSAKNSLSESSLYGLGGDSSQTNDQNPYGLSDEALRAAKANGYAEVDEKLKSFGYSKEQDVSTLQEVSIFKQVSTRYFMNYNRFFEKKKDLVPEAKATTPEKTSAQ